MNEFTNNLTSFSWWLGVVVVGLLINLVSAYLKSPIDNLGSKFSTSWRNRTLRSREKFKLDVDKAIKDQNWRNFCSTQALIHRSKSNAWLLLVLMELILAAQYKTIISLSKITPSSPNIETPNMIFQIIVFIGGVAFMVLAYKSAGEASNLEQILKATQERLDEN
jgi:flagellar biosynthesis protein FlhB